LCNGGGIWDLGWVWRVSIYLDPCPRAPRSFLLSTNAHKTNRRRTPSSSGAARREQVALAASAAAQEAAHNRWVGGNLMCTCLGGCHALCVCGGGFD
jgi:hypothetical protein